MHRRRSDASCRGLTRVEVVVIVAVVALLLAVLVPAVQRAREQARMAQCKNNLKELGLALHNYRDTYNVLSPGFISEHGWGFGVMILPHIDANPWYNKLSPNGPMRLAGKEYHRQRDVVRLRMNVYLCPANPPANEGTVRLLVRSFGEPQRFETLRTQVNPKTAVETDVPGKRTPIGISHYVGIMGDRDARCPDRSGNGVLFHNSSVRLDQITDGTGNTVMLGERDSVRHIGSNWAGTSWDVRDPSRCKDPHFVVEYCDATRQINGESPHAFGSLHPGGAHFLRADGAVRFLQETIDLQVYQNLANRHDAQRGGNY